MRQRRIRDLDEKLKDYEDLFTGLETDRKGRWRELFTGDVNLSSGIVPGETSFLCAAGPATDNDTAGAAGLSDFDEASGAGRPADSGGETRAAGPVSCAGGPAETSSGRVPLYLEIGSGKGKFITGMAAAHPYDFFLAIEGNPSVAWYALRRIREQGAGNVRMILGYAEDVTDMFSPGEIDGIYLNFSDPWPKARHVKRRLTNAARLSSYAGVLKQGGTVEFRTDNRIFFDWTAAEFEKQEKFVIEDMTKDLHGREPADGFVTTEYEDKFVTRGIPVCYLRARVL